MANIQVSDRAMVTIVSSLFNQRVMSTFCFGLSALTGTATITNALTRLHAALSVTGNLYERYFACCPAELTRIEYWLQVISPSRYAKVTFTTGPTGGTLADNEYLSPNQAFTILRRGEQGNRSNVSTLHVPLGQSPGCQASGQIGGDLETAAEALAAQMIVQVTTTTVVATWDPVINNGPNAGDYTPIVLSSVNYDVKTMRRRTLRLGI